MNELVTDIKSLELETLKNLKNSKAANTLKSLSRLILKIFQHFVQRMD